MKSTSWIPVFAIVTFGHRCSGLPVEIWNPESRMAIYVDADPVYDAQAPGQQPAGQGVALTTGAASFAQTPGAAQNWMPASLGGPYDLDPASYPQINNMNYPQMSGDPTQFASGAGGAVGLVQGSVQPSNLRSDPYFLPVGYDARPPTIHMGSVNFPKLSSLPIQLTNAASGTVINTGSADKGQLSATGKTNTNTGPMGALSRGTGSISGQGLGLTGTQVNSGQASTGTAPGPNAPSSASSNNNFVNSLQAEKGRILGNSNTVSRTGANGNAFGSSTGTASGLGEGVQLTQVANSDSQGSGTETGVMQPGFSQPWKDTRRTTWM